MASVALTKKQRESSLGLELLSLLVNITADGQLDNQEIEQLKNWIDENKNNSEFKSIEFLSHILEEILKDKFISDEELVQLQSCIEKVMPVEHREIAKLRRKEFKIQYRAKENEDLLLDLDVMVQGTWVGVRPDIINGMIDTDDELLLIPYPANPYDPNAVMVCTLDGRHIGYVPRDEAREASPLLQKGCKYKCWVKKILGSDRKPIPVIIAELYKGDTSRGSLRSSFNNIKVKPSDPNDRDMTDRSSFSGAIYLLFAFIGLAVIASIFSSF